MTLDIYRKLHADLTQDRADVIATIKRYERRLDEAREYLKAIEIGISELETELQREEATDEQIRTYHADSQGEG